MWRVRDCDCQVESDIEELEDCHFIVYIDVCPSGINEDTPAQVRLRYVPFVEIKDQSEEEKHILDVVKKPHEVVAIY